MLGDGKTAYDNAHDNAANEIAACSENFRRRDIPTKARLTYVKGRMLQLKLQLKETDQWVKCFEIDAVLPDSPWIGFSALTGDVSDNHDIIRVDTHAVTLRREFRNARQSPMAADAVNNAGAGKLSSGKGRPGNARRGGAAGWFLFLMKIIGVLAFVAFAVAAFRTYNAQQKSRRNW